MVHRGLIADDVCPRRGEGKEDVSHLLMYCNEA